MDVLMRPRLNETIAPSGIGRLILITLVLGFLPACGLAIAVIGLLPDEARTALVISAALVPVAALVSAVIVWRMVERTIVQPFNALRDSAAHIETGEPVEPFPLAPDAPRGFDDLGRSISRMASDRKILSQELETIRRERSEVLRELNHRVRNNLQMIASLLDLQARYGNADERHVLRGPQRRIRALSLAYRAAYANGEIDSVSLFEVLDELAQEFRTKIDETGLKVEFSRSGDDPEIGLDSAIPCCLLINELFNAHVAQNAPTPPIIVIDVTRRGNDVSIDLFDRANDQASAPLGPLSERLTEAFRYQLNASLDQISAETEDGGTRQVTRLTFPAENAI